MKIIIGFTYKTSKIIPRLFCHRFRHCAVIIKKNKKYIMFQVGSGKINLISLKFRDLKILEQYGWIFLTKDVLQLKQNLKLYQKCTCVKFAKKIIGIKNPLVFTPYGLYRLLNRL